MLQGQKRWLPALVIAVLLGTGPLAAQTKPKIVDAGVAQPQTAIFIGNSFFYYNNSMHNHLRLLARSAEPAVKFSAVSVTISGSGFGCP